VDNLVTQNQTRADDDTDKLIRQVLGRRYLGKKVDVFRVVLKAGYYGDYKAVAMLIANLFNVVSDKLLEIPNGKAFMTACIADNGRIHFKIVTTVGYDCDWYMFIADNGKHTGQELETLLGMRHIPMYDDEKKKKNVLFAMDTESFAPGKIASRPDSMYIYCDVVVDQFIGNVKAPILAQVPIQGAQDARIQYDATVNNFLPLNTNCFDTVTVDIRDVFGNPIKFSDGDCVVLKLLFHRIRAGVFDDL